MIRTPIAYIILWSNTFPIGFFKLHWLKNKVKCRNFLCIISTTARIWFEYISSIHVCKMSTNLPIILQWCRHNFVVLETFFFFFACLVNRLGQPIKSVRKFSTSGSRWNLKRYVISNCLPNAFFFFLGGGGGAESERWSVVNCHV